MDDQVLSQSHIEEQPAVAGQVPSGAEQAGERRSFAMLLESLREARGLTKADLAKRAGVDPSTITRFEQGSRLPERQTVLQLADAMVLPVTDRDTLLASAGFRSGLWDDPMLTELIQLLADPGVPDHARQEARSAIRMAISYLKLQRLQDS